MAEEGITILNGVPDYQRLLEYRRSQRPGELDRGRRVISVAGAPLDLELKSASSRNWACRCSTVTASPNAPGHLRRTAR